MVQVCVRKARVVAGVIMLEQAPCTVLGGNVQSMREEWEVARRLGRASRAMMQQQVNQCAVCRCWFSYSLLSPHFAFVSARGQEKEDCGG
jgi:hypothetical protein